MTDLIILLILALLVALSWGSTVYLILIRRFKNRRAGWTYNRWTAILMGLNLICFLPGLIGLGPGRLPGLGQQLWLLTVVTDGLATGGLLVFGLVVLLFRRSRPPQTVDYLIVLGAGLMRGKIPPVLAGRLIAAGQFWQSHPAATIIVTGGRVHGDQLTEAQAMGDFLLKLGLPPEKLLREQRARNTWQNLTYSQRLIAHGWTGKGQPQVAVITSSFHVPRAWDYSRRLGLHFHFISAPTPWRALALALVRDYLGIIRDHRWGALLLLVAALVLGEWQL